MSLHETSRSLSIYFIVVGLIGFFWNLSFFINHNLNVFGLIIWTISISFSVAYIYIGYKFRHLISTHPQLIFRILHFSFGYLCLTSLLSVLAGDVGKISTPFIGGLLIWYLARNVRRLSSESQPFS